MDPPLPNITVSTRQRSEQDRTKCAGFSENPEFLHCNETPQVFCHHCDLAFCRTCDAEHHFQKKPAAHKRTYADADNNLFRPCAFRTHPRRPCAQIGLSNCSKCQFEELVCLDCMYEHHYNTKNNHLHIIDIVPAIEMYPLTSMLFF